MKKFARRCKVSGSRIPAATVAFRRGFRVPFFFRGRCGGSGVHVLSGGCPDAHEVLVRPKTGAAFCPHPCVWGLFLGSRTLPCFFWGLFFGFKDFAAFFLGLFLGSRTFFFFFFFWVQGLCVFFFCFFWVQGLCCFFVLFFFGFKDFAAFFLGSRTLLLFFGAFFLVQGLCCYFWGFFVRAELISDRFF